MLSSLLLSLPLLCFVVSAADVVPPVVPNPIGPVTACGAQAVLDTCISSTTAIAMSCQTTDYNCLCQKYTDVLTCYNNCPNDPRISGAQATKTSYCSTASAYSSTTIMPSNTMSSMTSSATSATTITGSHPSYTSSTISTSGTAGTSTSSTASPSSTDKSEGDKASISVTVMLCAILAMMV